jgi:HEAT repeat protein
VTPTAVANSDKEQNKAKDGISDEEISALIGNLLSDNLLITNAARNELIEISKPAVPLLISALENSRTKTRYLICEILGELRDERAIPAITKLLFPANNTDTGIAATAARNLRNFGNLTVIPSLIQVVTSTDADLKYEAVKTLGALRARQALPQIRQLITDTAITSLGYTVKAAAVEAIGKLKDAYSLQRLIELLTTAETDETGTEAFSLCIIQALERITNHQEGSFSRLKKKNNELLIKRWSEWWEKNKKSFEQE